MADRTKIEWAEASWTPVRARRAPVDPLTGMAGKPRIGWHCTHASEGCRNCYAEGMNLRLGTGLAYKPGHEAAIEIFLDETMLTQPLRWKRPRMIFVCSMTDLFADFCPDEMIDQVFAVMALCPQHVFQVLTKRPERMRAYLSDPRTPFRLARKAVDLWTDGAVDAPLMGATWPVRSIGDDDVDPDDIVLETWPLPNVWAGASVEDQATADKRIPELLATPAAVRWISAEPLLGPVDLTEGCNGHYFFNALRGTRWHDDPDGVPHYSSFPPVGREAKPGVPASRLDWVVVGGESGPKARPMHPDWARSLRDQCAAAGVPFFFKQHGEWAPSSDLPIETVGMREQATVLPDGRVREWQHDFPDARLTDPKMRPMTRVGKKAAGRLLDGREWNEFPEVRP